MNMLRDLAVFRHVKMLDEKEGGVLNRVISRLDFDARGPSRGGGNYQRRRLSRRERDDRFIQEVQRREQ